MNWRRFWLLLFAIVTLIGCNTQPTSIVGTSPASTDSLSPSPLTDMPAPTAKPTIQDPQIEAVKAIFSNYAGKTNPCEWDLSRVGCDDQGNIILLNARS